MISIGLLKVERDIAKLTPNETRSAFRRFIDEGSNSFIISGTLDNAGILFKRLPKLMTLDHSRLDVSLSAKITKQVVAWGQDGGREAKRRTVLLLELKEIETSRCVFKTVVSLFSLLDDSVEETFCQIPQRVSRRQSSVVRIKNHRIQHSFWIDLLVVCLSFGSHTINQ